MSASVCLLSDRISPELVMKHSSPLLIYFMPGIRPFYSVAMKQTIVRTHIVRA